MKWKDKREVLLLSTKHTDEMSDIKVRGETKHKPTVIIAYNDKSKRSIDLSDQMSRYSSALRKSIKWYCNSCDRTFIWYIYGQCTLSLLKN